jgi:hypothetical protein
MKLFPLSRMKSGKIRNLLIIYVVLLFVYFFSRYIIVFMAKLFIFLSFHVKLFFLSCLII